MSSEQDHYQKEEFDYKKLMEETRNDIPPQQAPHKSNCKSKNIWGLFLIVYGVLFLLKTMNIGFPRDIFRWEYILIAVGLILGFNARWKGTSWLALVAIGAVFLFSDAIFSSNKVAFPLIMILAGVLWFYRGRKSYNNPYDDWTGNATPEKEGTQSSIPPGPVDQSEKLDITAIFAGIKKNVVSKSFKGGDVVAIFGGAEINLMNADFYGKIKLDSVNICGGTKIFVPADWDVRSEAVAILGGVEDKRRIRPDYINPNKRLVIDGVALMGGIEIRTL